MASSTMAGFGLSLAVDENRPLTWQSSGKMCKVCGDTIGLKEDGELFVACYASGVPVCQPCYEYERTDGTQCCPQCNARCKHQKVQEFAGDDDDNSDKDDFDDEFQTKNHEDNSDRHENGDYNNQQWHPNVQAFSVAGSTAGKDFEGEMEIYGSTEWKERVEKWKVRQEKRGLVSNDDGRNDQAEEEEDYL